MGLDGQGLTLHEECSILYTVYSIDPKGFDSPKNRIGLAGCQSDRSCRTFRIHQRTGDLKLRTIKFGHELKDHGTRNI